MAFCDVGAGVLALAGLIKFFDPTPWVTSLGALGVPLGPVRFRRSVVAAARLVGVSEVAIAVLVFAVGGTLALGLLAVAYAVFVVVSVIATRRGGASCGCFGVRSAPISSLHVGLDAVVAAAAVVGAVDGADALAVRLGDGVGATVAYLVFLGLGVAAMVTVMTTGAELWALKRSVVPLAARTGPR
mgnify:FL=1